MEQKEFYALIGEFCVEFEQLCLSMENAVEGVLERAGLDGFNNRQLRNIILDSKTADPLQKMLRAMWANELNREPDKDLKNKYKKLCDYIFNKSFKNLVEVRNKLVHTKWCAPIDDAKYKNETIVGKKIKAGASGDCTLFHSFSEMDVINKIDECKNLQNMIGSVSYWLTMHHKYPDNFKFDDFFIIENNAVKLKS